MKITFLGNELNLLGTQVKVGDKLPNATLTKNDMEQANIYDYEGIKVISIVPSLDTGVCDFQTREFNTKLPKNTTVLTVSNDLPFAQARWCGAAEIDNVITLSDYLNHNFGLAYGSLIDELKLQTRAVIIANDKNEVVYVEYLDEITNHPNYEEAIKVVNSL